jgi:hypothetical protein
MSEQVDEVLTQVPSNTKRRQSSDPKPSMALKRAWHKACFQPLDRKSSKARRRLAGAWMSLKAFAKMCDLPIAKTWVANKHGASNQKKVSAG